MIAIEHEHLQTVGRQQTKLRHRNNAYIHIIGGAVGILRRDETVGVIDVNRNPVGGQRGIATQWQNDTGTQRPVKRVRIGA